MVKRSIDYILKRIKDTDKAVIVGAGKRGHELLECLEEWHVNAIVYFLDNNEALMGHDIHNIRIIKPCKIDGCIYIIAVDSMDSRKEFFDQLQKLGVEKRDIIIYYAFRDYEYLSNLDEKYYEDELQEMYWERFGKRIDWKNPVTYNEKINWEKLNIKDERRTRLADKYLVRDWIKEKIGERYLTKLYGVWDNADEIDFESLPNSFVLKVNNGSVRNIIVKDKEKIDKSEICSQLNQWKDCNFAYGNLELHYKDIIPKIICEEYLEGVADNVYDYNIFCFHGKPKYIWCIKGSHKPDCRASFYDTNWEVQPFSYGYPRDPVIAERPKQLDEMLRLSEILCEEFLHVRVDWYNLPDGRIIFGEMTFSTWAGFEPWEPEEYDTYFGNLI